jgi:hypothetical protein
MSAPTNLQTRRKLLPTRSRPHVLLIFPFANSAENLAELEYRAKSRRAKSARGSSAIRKAAAGLRSAAALPRYIDNQKVAHLGLLPCLLQRGIDIAELGAQIATDAVDRSDDS